MAMSCVVGERISRRIFIWWYFSVSNDI